MKFSSSPLSIFFALLALTLVASLQLIRASDVASPEPERAGSHRALTICDGPDCGSSDSEYDYEDEMEEDRRVPRPSLCKIFGGCGQSYPERGYTGSLDHKFSERSLCNTFGGCRPLYPELGLGPLQVHDPFAPSPCNWFGGFFCRELGWRRSMDHKFTKKSLCNTSGGCGQRYPERGYRGSLAHKLTKRSLCNTFGGCGQWYPERGYRRSMTNKGSKRSLCNTFGGCGPWSPDESAEESMNYHSSKRSLCNTFGGCRSWFPDESSKRSLSTNVAKRSMEQSNDSPDGDSIEASNGGNSRKERVNEILDDLVAYLNTNEDYKQGKYRVMVPRPSDAVKPSTGSQIDAVDVQELSSSD